MKQILMLGMALLLAGCSGPDRFKGSRAGSPSNSSVSRSAPVASGPISAACLASDRKARSRQLCGCIQVAANKTLNNTQQRRAVQFYSNPHLAQEVRQSDRSADERFWQAYANYGEHAKALCN